MRMNKKPLKLKERRKLGNKNLDLTALHFRDTTFDLSIIIRA